MGRREKERKTERKKETGQTWKCGENRPQGKSNKEKVLRKKETKSLRQIAVKLHFTPTNKTFLLPSVLFVL